MQDGGIANFLPRANVAKENDIGGESAHEIEITDGLFCLVRLEFLQTSHCCRDASFAVISPIAVEANCLAKEEWNAVLCFTLQGLHGRVEWRERELSEASAFEAFHRKGELDLERTCTAILDDFRSGKFGKISLEQPNDR